MYKGPRVVRCRELEARIAELEAAVAPRNDARPAVATSVPESFSSRSESSPSASEGSDVLTLPLVEFKALRLLPFGWGEGWQLRPSPPRRHWMDELPHAYKCLPLLLANQWGWQILCPTDVVVTWDGLSSPSGLFVEVAPQFEPAVKSQFGTGSSPSLRHGYSEPRRAGTSISRGPAIAGNPIVSL